MWWLSVIVGVGLRSVRWSGLEMTVTDDEIYICANCAGERGYRMPNDGLVGSARTKCAMCGKFELCFMLDDLDSVFKDLEKVIQ